MHSAATLDLSKVYRSPVFRSRSSVESHRELSSALSEHRLRWGSGEVATSLYRRDLQHSSVMILSYGAEVEVTPAPFEGFVLVQMPLRGTAEVECDGTPIRIGYGEVAVLAPRRSVRLLWQPGCEQLIVKLPHELLRRAACRDCPLGHCTGAAACTVWGSSVGKIAPAAASQWLALMQQLLALLPAGHNGAAQPQHPQPHPAWLGPFEQTAALFLHEHYEASADGALPAGARAPGSSAGSDRDTTAGMRLERLEAFIRSRPFAPLSLVDLARVAGVTTRTLNAICHRNRGVSPMELLRNLRLEGARDRLLQDEDASITDVALEHGFGHLGRFSAYYRERFGELPRQTGKRVR